MGTEGADRWMLPESAAREGLASKRGVIPRGRNCNLD